MFNVYKMLFLALKKVWIVKITPHQIPTTRQKNFHYSKIFNCSHMGEFPPASEHYLVKTWISHLHRKRILGKKWLRLKLTSSNYCVPSCWKNPYSRSWYIRLNNFEANWTQIYHMLKKVLFGEARSLIYPESRLRDVSSINVTI